MLRGMSVAYVCCCEKNRNEVDRDSVEAEVQGMWKRPERHSVEGQRRHLEGLMHTPIVGRSAGTPGRL